MTYIHLSPSPKDKIRSESSVSSKYTRNRSCIGVFDKAEHNNSHNDAACIDTDSGYYKNCSKPNNVNAITTTIDDALPEVERRKKKTKNVRFDSMVTLQRYEVPRKASKINKNSNCNSNYNSWYTKKELKSFKLEAVATIHMIVKNKDNANRTDSSQYYCSRGVECNTPIGRVLKLKRRRKSINAVLSTQKKQQQQQRRTNRRNAYDYDDDDSSCSSSSSDSSSSSSSLSSSFSTLLLPAVSTSSSLSLMASFFPGNPSKEVEEEENEYYRKQRKNKAKQIEMEEDTKEIARIYTSLCKTSVSLAYYMGKNDETIARKLHQQKKKKPVISVKVEERDDDDDNDDVTVSSDFSSSSTDSSSSTISVSISNSQCNAMIEVELIRNSPSSSFLQQRQQHTVHNSDNDDHDNANDTEDIFHNLEETSPLSPFTPVSVAKKSIVSSTLNKSPSSSPTSLMSSCVWVKSSPPFVFRKVLLPSSSSPKIRTTTKERTQTLLQTQRNILVTQQRTQQRRKLKQQRKRRAARRAASKQQQQQ